MGFAVAKNVNLLAACGMWLDHGAAGTGIYSGENGYLKLDLHDTGVGTMLVSDLPKVRYLNDSNVRGNLNGIDSTKVMKKKVGENIKNGIL